MKWKDDESGKTRCKDALTELMGYRNLSAKALADKSGVPFNTLRQITRGKTDLRSTSAGYLLMLASALEVDPMVLGGFRSVAEFKQEELSAMEPTVDPVIAELAEKISVLENEAALSKDLLRKAQSDIAALENKYSSMARRFHWN